MTLRGLVDAWFKFWFAPDTPTPIGLFRIFFGLLVLDAAIIHIGPDVLDWYGPHGVTSADAVHRYWWLDEPRLDIFLLVPNTETGVMALWYVFVAAVVCLLIGLWTRAAAVVVTIFLISMDNRQPFAINGGDAMMRLLAGYLIFSEAGAAFSVDRLIQRWRNPTFGIESRPKPVPQWGQRMIQVQMAITYWSTFCAKISGAQWIDGTAVYYATRLDDMINHPMFLYDSLLFCKFLTWYTLLFEGAMFSLIWIRDLRYWVLAGTLVMHLGIDYSINLPVFEWIFMTSFIVFIYPEDLTKVMDFIKKRINATYGPPATLLYDPASERQTSEASVLEGIDILGRLNIKAIEPGDKVADGQQRLVGLSEYGPISNGDLFAWLTARLPILWPLFLFIGLPWQLMLRQPKPSTAGVKESSIKPVDEQQQDLQPPPNGDALHNTAEQTVSTTDESKDAT
jgi:hypothetical protein